MHKKKVNGGFIGNISSRSFCRHTRSIDRSTLFTPASHFVPVVKKITDEGRWSEGDCGRGPHKSSTLSTFATKEESQRTQSDVHEIAPVCESNKLLRAYFNAQKTTTARVYDACNVMFVDVYRAHTLLQ